MKKTRAIIRPLHPRDFHAGFLETLEKLSPLDGLTSMKAYEIFARKMARHHSDIYRIFVAELDDEIIGAITLLVEQKFIHHGGKVGHIEDVATRQGFERRGIGRALVERALAEAVDAGCYKVILDCGEHNVAFYEKLGFKKHEVAMRHDLISPSKKR